MTLLGGLIGLIMFFAALIGLAIVAVSVAIWPPSIFFLIALIALGWHEWKVAKRISAQKKFPNACTPVKAKAKQHRGPRPVQSWIDDPDLPSSLD